MVRKFSCGRRCGWARAGVVSLSTQIRPPIVQPRAQQLGRMCQSKLADTELRLCMHLTPGRPTSVVEPQRLKVNGSSETWGSTPISTTQPHGDAQQSGSDGMEQVLRGARGPRVLLVDRVPTTQKSVPLVPRLHDGSGHMRTDLRFTMAKSKTYTSNSRQGLPKGIGWQASLYCLKESRGLL